MNAHADRKVTCLVTPSRRRPGLSDNLVVIAIVFPRDILLSNNNRESWLTAMREIKIKVKDLREP
jgi:hypothetical protein